MDTDRNRLFGALTVQGDLVNEAQLTEACTAWASGEAETLADAMVSRGLISPADRDEVERLVDRKLAEHGGDVAATLAATLDSDARARGALTQVDDASVRATMSMAPDRAGHVVISAIGPAPDSKGRYTRTHLHATGGIGRVWRARDSSFGREVALKEIRPEREGNDAIWARFLEEARITGQLEHPGIVPVYELGTGADGEHPFYTMRFVKGRTLVEACHDYHKARIEGTATPLDLAGLLGAFVGVCNAVAYAHSRGVIHRDLKGQNVVLGDFGEVIVLDWGLAKIVDGPDAGSPDMATLPEDRGGRFQTLAGRAIGTPAYMPPEQAQGRLDVVDKLSDVYGLGAILYEILCGRAPFDGGTTSEVLRKVIEQEPPRPRAVVPATPPALEAICLKALAKTQTGRYPSAQALADDVRRWLADEPVSAYPEPLAVRAGRWVKRHKAPVAAAAALLATATVALSVSSVLIRRERDEARFQRNEAQLQRNEAQAQRTEAQLQRNEARTQRGQARSAVDDMYTEVAEKWLEDRLDPLQKQFLEKALAYYETFAGQGGAELPVRQERGRAYQRMGDILLKLGRREEADRAYRKAAEVLGAVTVDFPAEPGPKHDLANARASLGVVLSDRGDFAGAKGLFEEARTIQAPLVDAGKATPREKLFLARADKGLAEVHRKRGEVSQAIGLFKDACAVIEATDFGGDGLVARKVLADARDRIGLIYKETGKLDPAAESFATEAAVLRKLVDEFPTMPGPRQALVNAVRSEGVIHQGMGRADEALASFRAAAESADRLAADFPLRPEYRRDQAKCHLNLGYTFWMRGEYDASEAHYREAIPLYERLIVEVPEVLQYRQDLARACNNLGALLKATGRPAEAERFGQRAVDVYTELVARAPDVPEYRKSLADSQMNLGILVETLAQAGRADDLYRRSQAGQQELADKAPGVPVHRADLAKVLVARGVLRINEANQGLIRANRRAHEPPALAGPGERWAWAIGQVADRLEASRLRREAGPMLRRAIALDEALVAQVPKAPDYRAKLGNALNSLSQVGPPDAEAISRRALAIFEKLADDDPKVAEYPKKIGLVSINLGELLRSAGRLEEAEASFVRAVAALEPLQRRQPGDIDLGHFLARSLAARGDLRLARKSPSEAKPLLERAVGLQRAVVRANSKDPENRSDLYDELQLLARADLALGEHVEAAVLAVEMAPFADGPTRGGLGALAVLARCAALAQTDPSLPTDRRREVARGYVDRAVGVIRGAMTAGPPLVGRARAAGPAGGSLLLAGPGPKGQASD